MSLSKLELNPFPLEEMVHSPMCLYNIHNNFVIFMCHCNNENSLVPQMICNFGFVP
jgi:hypothetical protein